MQFQSRPVEGIISAIGRSNRKNVEDLKSCLERGPKPALFRFSKKLSLARLKRAIERVSCFYLARSRWHKFSQRRSIHFFFLLSRWPTDDFSKQKFYATRQRKYEVWFLYANFFTGVASFRYLFIVEKNVVEFLAYLKEMHRWNALKASFETIKKERTVRLT